MADLPSPEEFRRRKAAEHDERGRQMRAQADLDQRREAARRQCAQLFEDFVTRARELKIFPGRFASHPPVGEGTVVWAEGFPTSEGVLSTGHCRYCVKGKPSRRRELSDVVRDVEELSLFTDHQTSDHVQSWELRGPVPVIRWHGLDLTGVTPEMLQAEVEALRGRLVESLLRLMP